MQLQSPLVDRSEVNEVGRDINEETQPANRRPSPDNRDVASASHRLLGIYKIYDIWSQKQAGAWNFCKPGRVRVSNVQDTALVGTAPITKAEVIGVWSDLLNPERLYNDVSGFAGHADFRAGQNHSGFTNSSQSRLGTGRRWR